MPPRPRPPARPGVAAVELAAALTCFIVPVMVGLLEVGRLVQVQQVVSNAAREGARLAAQGFTTLDDGTQVQMKVASGTPNVRDAVFQYLLASGLTGLTADDIEVTFTYTTARVTDYLPTSADPPGTSYPAGSFPPDPCYGEKNQLFTLTVRIKEWSKVRWVSLGVVNPADVRATVSWRMLTDDPFTVNETLPSL